MSVLSFHAFFCSLTSVSKKQNRENASPSLFMQLTKVLNKMNEKQKPGVSEYRHPEYVNRQINSRILEFLLKQFYCLIFAPP